MPNKQQPPLAGGAAPSRSTAPSAGGAAPTEGTAPPQKETAQGFVGSVFKFSISTYVNFAVYGLGILLINFMVPDITTNGNIQTFLSSTNLIMTIGILGLDQSLIRFFNEPPARLTSSGLFRVCLYISGGVLVAAGLVCTLFFSKPLLALLDFGSVGSEVVPLLFLAALFYMVARYFNVLYRMEQNILLYTLESVLMNFFFRLFYLLGAFFQNQFQAMMLCAVGGLGAFALFFCVWRRRDLRLRAGEMNRKALATILPYGVSLAPTAVLIHLNSVFSLIVVNQALGGDARGTYSFAINLSNIVTTVQAGFASFWGAYMFANYKTQQVRIRRVHGYLNLVILVFFSLLVGFEDILFLILRNYAMAQPIFPLMMLSAVFTILCETTVYGIAIAKRPIFDTLGIALAFVVNVALCLLLLPLLGLVGAAVALAGANLAMYLFRTIIAQRFYRTIDKPLKTAAALLLAIALAVAGTLLAGQFLWKLAASLAAAGAFCLLYRQELARLVTLALEILKGLVKRHPQK